MSSSAAADPVDGIPVVAEQVPLFDYVLRLGDASLVLGHRLSEWCGHAPAIEEDIALVNVALDLIGQARSWLSYAGEIEGEGRDEDALAYLRDVMDWRNPLLVEQPNGNFADTIARQFLFDAYQLELYEALMDSADPQVAAIAEKSVKETAYHRRHSAQWMIRLGDGTEESHEKMQAAVNALWTYTGELFEVDAVERAMADAAIGVDPSTLKPGWDAAVDEVFAEARLERPEDGWMQSGGKSGRHSEHLGYILAETQYLQRAYPGAKW